MDPTAQAEQPAPTRLSVRYIALLVGVAALVLVIGALLRPGKSEPIPVVPTTELATLPERSQRRVLRDYAGFVGERTGAVEASVVFLPQVGASGLVIGRDSVLSVAPAPGRQETPGTGAPRVLLQHGTGVTRPPASIAAGVDTLTRRWSLVVARSAEGPTLSLAGLTGGVGRVHCGELELRELIFDAPVPAAFTGGAMFDLDGNALGLAVPCEGRLALVPLADLVAVLDRQRRPEQQVWARYGFRAEPADSLTRRLLGADSGSVVTEVLVGGPADAAGLRAGDVVAGGLDLEALAAAPDTTALRVRRTAGGVAVTLVPDTASAGAVEMVAGPPRLPPGLSIRHLAPDSRGARAGLQPDDRILQIGRNRQPAPAALRRALADSAPVFIVYERAGRRRSLVLH